jgi:hypothetical protein
MTTIQKFFTNIVHSNAITYQVLDETIGDMNKNIGVSAHFFESASEIIGSTVTENYDLASILAPYQSEIQSNQTDYLLQSLQNVKIGLTNTENYPSFNLCTHISTTILNYNFGFSSTFLSGEIYSFSAVGINKTSVISIPYSSFDLSGNQFNSHLFDAPIDFAVYGNDNFNISSGYVNSNLIRFDYAWSYAQPQTNLLIKLNYINSSISNYNLTFYWGNNDSSFISTNSNTNSSIKYVGTQNFINKLGILTTSSIQTNITSISGRKNFWSNTTPYSIGFTTQCFVESDPYLWAPDRINETLIDGVFSEQSQPTRYFAYENVNFNNILSSNQNYVYFYGDFITSGTKQNTSANASYDLKNLFESNFASSLNIKSLEKLYNRNVPANIFIFEKNPKKINLQNDYSIVYNTQIVPSAFVKVIPDENLWIAFAEYLPAAKNYSLALNELKSLYLNTLDNFIADLFFGVNFNNVDEYFAGENLIISRNTLKNFTQPYGTTDTPPLNFSEYEEKSIYEAVHIVSSKEFLIFDQGRLTLYNDYNLPSDTAFEIYKPISLVCNGIDPYSQGQGLALDYTLNLKFGYNNQNYLNKILYLMASKYLISESDYNNRIFNNQDTIGYYYLANPDSTDYSDYSVSSINEFRLYGYSGLIPNLKDGSVVPILTKSFSPKDSTKYTYEEFIDYLRSQGITNSDDINEAIQDYLDAGNSFYTINLDKFSNNFNALTSISICAANYVVNQPKYWNEGFDEKFLEPAQIDDTGFTNLTANILSGIATAFVGSPPYTISNIPVGYNCRLKSVTVNSFGSSQIPGGYTAWFLPPDNQKSDEQPAQIEFSILSSGILDPSSIKILNPGSNFYFGFSTFLNVGFTSTGIGTSSASITLVMDNVSEFSATVNTSKIITSFTQTKPPAIGYNAGFKFNPRALVGLGYTSFADIDIKINNAPTIDSFLIAPLNLQPGDLENINNFSTPNTNLSNLNYTAGSQTYLLYEDEIFNSITVPYSFGNKQISFVTISCKLIELNGKNPSGDIQFKIYALEDNIKTEVASSDRISITEISRNSYSDLNIPIYFNFANTLVSLSQSVYYVSIKQNLTNCFLSIKGSFTGISTSDYSILSSDIYNDPNYFIIAGGISTNGYDLDIAKAPINLSNIFGSDLLISDTIGANINLRKNSEYEGANNLSLKISTTYNSETGIIFSNLVNVASLSSTFTGVAFTFNSTLYSGTIINSASLISANPLFINQAFASRSLSQYDGVLLGMSTLSQIGLSNTSVNFNFVFNKLFNQVSPDIYGAFNYTDKSQFGLAKPNRLRESDPVNVVDGYWSYKSDLVNQPLSIYPRAFLNNTSVIGTSLPVYQYLGYSHDIYVNIGYNSNGIYNQETITLNAYPKWKVTWMDRTTSNYKNFSIFNVIQQSYVDSINYLQGSANTIIGISTGVKSGIFEGTFQPSGNLASTVPVSITIGTSAGVQLYINNNSQPLIDTFSTISTGIIVSSSSLSVSERSLPVYFKVYYFSLSTSMIQVNWNVGAGNTLINYNSISSGITPNPVSLNSGAPIDNIVFFNVSKTLEDAESVNSGYPPGDSFVIRSS